MEDRCGEHEVDPPGAKNHERLRERTLMGLKQHEDQALTDRQGRGTEVPGGKLQGQGETGGWISPELVRRAQAGDEAAWEDLLARSEPIVRGAVRRTLGIDAGHPDAKDILHDAYVRVLKSLSTLKDPAAFPRWLYEIATNLCRDLLRRSQREEPLVESTANKGGEESDPHLLAIAREQFKNEQETFGATLFADLLRQALGQREYEALLLQDELPRADLLRRFGLKKTAYYEWLKFLELQAAFLTAQAQDLSEKNRREIKIKFVKFFCAAPASLLESRCRASRDMYGALFPADIRGGDGRVREIEINLSDAPLSYQVRIGRIVEAIEKALNRRQEPSRRRGSPGGGGGGRNVSARNKPAHE
jgi:RNA polymerase sigma factor (sigma-70 family)